MNKEIHSSLVRYFNTSCLTKQDFALALLAPQLPLKKNAPIIKSMYSLLSKGDSEKGQTKRVHFSLYEGSQPTVKKIQQLFDTHISEDLVGAYLHGSLATNEEIPYSDFDGILIIKDEVFCDEARLIKLAKTIQKSIPIIHTFDPLQHHGWFIITEKMLHNFPEHYFPSALFHTSVSLLKRGGMELSFQTLPHHYNEKEHFETYASRLAEKLTACSTPKNMFYLKSLLSEFMLVPAMFLLAKTSEYVNKKDSFTQAREHFETGQWEIMDRVSAVRSQWHYQINPIQKAGLTSNSATIRKLSRKFAPKIPQEIAKQLTPHFFEEMKAFVQLCVLKINQ